MKSLKTFRIPVLLGAFGAFLFFAPPSHAQECDPQHFDDTAAVSLTKAQVSPKVSTKQGALQSNKNPKATVQSVTSRQSQNSHNAAAVVPAKQTLKKPDQQ